MRRPAIIPIPVSLTPGFDFFIGPGGSDGNAGTQLAPWSIKSLLSTSSSFSTAQTQANRSAMAGKRVGILSGTYFTAQYASGISDPDQLVLNVPSGSAGSPTIIQAVNPRLAIIDGTDGSGNRVNNYFTGNGCGIIGQSYLYSDSGNVTLKDLVIRKGYRYLVHWRYTAAPIAAAFGSRFSGVTVDGCDISDINLNGRGTGDNIALIQAYTTQDMQITNTKLANARGDTTVSDANGYGVITWSCNASIYDSLSITDCKDGIYTKNQAQTGLTIRNSYIDLTAYSGPGVTNAIFGMDFANAGSQHALIHHCVLVAQNCIRVHDLSLKFNGPSQIYNNTCVPIGGVSFVTVGVQTYGSNQPVDFYNNILYRSGASSSEEGDMAFSSGNTSSRVNYNCYPASPRIGRDTGGDSFPDNTYNSTAACSAATGFEANSLSTDPLFIGGAGPGGYQLQAGSPCKSAGKSDGTSGGSAVDIGAYGNNPPSIIGTTF